MGLMLRWVQALQCAEYDVLEQACELAAGLLRGLLRLSMGLGGELTQLIP